MRRQGDRNKSLPEQLLPVIEKSASSWSTLRGTRRPHDKTTLSDPALDEIWQSVFKKRNKNE